ncbi:MAG: YbhB/YbcL family Raf kinase inhibitor-like protein [Caulobacteraceae bacterium]
MLEHLPRGVGRALKDVRPGLEKVVFNDAVAADAPDCIEVASSAFEDGAALPVRFTADGDKLSPPLAWKGVPEGTAAVVLLIEDPDAPAPAPLVHTIAWALPGADGELAEGDLKSPAGEGQDLSLGRNSFLGAEYLPPDPPPAHGPHRYVFQVYAVNAPLELHGKPIRTQLVHAMKGHVIGKGSLIGTYERA